MKDLPGFFFFFFSLSMSNRFTRNHPSQATRFSPVNLLRCKNWPLLCAVTASIVTARQSRAGPNGLICHLSIRRASAGASLQQMGHIIAHLPDTNPLHNRLFTCHPAASLALFVHTVHTKRGWGWGATVFKYVLHHDSEMCCCNLVHNNGRSPVYQNRHYTF